jgi:hypothetical protein
MSFSVTPIGASVPASPQVTPRFIQFRCDGIDLGGPDADTVDFVGDIFAVRGTSGGDENTVTVMMLTG